MPCLVGRVREGAMFAQPDGLSKLCEVAVDRARRDVRQQQEEAVQSQDIGLPYRQDSPL